MYQYKTHTISKMRVRHNKFIRRKCIGEKPVDFRVENIHYLLLLFLCVPHNVTSQCRNLKTKPNPVLFSGFYVGLYNPNIRRCDFPQNVDCVDDPVFTTLEWDTPTAPPVPTRTIPSRTSTNFPTRTIPTRTLPTETRQWKCFIENLTCLNRTTIPHPICEYFYKCIKGKAGEMKCEHSVILNSDRCSILRVLE